jgi:16S rRNA (uracil1498-N3)-methyltransferase
MSAMPRFYCPAPLQPDALLRLPPQAARHVQVLRLQPGQALTLFNGEGGEFAATVTQMGRSEVQVRIGAHQPLDRAPNRAVTLALGMPANERMDWLVEKATELGAAVLQPLMTERSVLRLSGERAEKKVAHWHSVAVAASEQCGGTRVPQLLPVSTLAAWLAKQPTVPVGARLLLSLQPHSPGLREAAAPLASDAPVTLLSGPEGGLSQAEEAAALASGFVAVSLGQRTLRAETAALAALAALLL